MKNNNQDIIVDDDFIHVHILKFIKFSSNCFLVCKRWNQLCYRVFYFRNGALLKESIWKNPYCACIVEKILTNPNVAINTKTIPLKQNALHLACASKYISTKLIKLLIDAKINVKACCLKEPCGLYELFAYNYNSYRGGYALHVACNNKKANVETIKLLINDKINEKTTHNFTPLHLACLKNSDIEIVKLLIDFGADVNAVDRDKLNALHIICRTGGNIEFAKLLIQFGINVNATDRYDQNALHLAFGKYRKNAKINLKMVKLLIDSGIKVNACDLWRKTPLYYALQNNNGSKLVKLLVDSGALK